jgi:hypothetical protein
MKILAAVLLAATLAAPASANLAFHADGTLSQRAAGVTTINDVDANFDGKNIQFAFTSPVTGLCSAFLVKQDSRYVYEPPIAIADVHPGLVRFGAPVPVDIVDPSFVIMCYADKDHIYFSQVYSTIQV